MVGRFVGAMLLQRFDARRLLALFAIAAMALLALTMSSKGTLAMWTMTSKASSLLIMGIVGGAVIPWVQGVLSDEVGIQPSFAIPLICYAFIVWYGFAGSRIRAGQGQHASAQASGVMH